MRVCGSDEWGADRQSVANLVEYVAASCPVIPADGTGMTALMLELRPRWSRQLNRADRLKRMGERLRWRAAWAGCKALKAGKLQVADVLG